MMKFAMKPLRLIAVKTPRATPSTMAKIAGHRSKFKRCGRPFRQDGRYRNLATLTIADAQIALWQRFAGTGHIALG